MVPEFSLSTALNYAKILTYSSNTHEFLALSILTYVIRQELIRVTSTLDI